MFVREGIHGDGIAVAGQQAVINPFTGIAGRFFLGIDGIRVRDGAGFRAGNVDITVMAEKPRIAAHSAAMIRNLSEDLDMPAERINIKATTTERLGFVGREEGLAASAVVLLATAGAA